MCNDDHLLVPIVNIVPDCQYNQENVTCLSHVAGVSLQDLANRPIKRRNVIHVHQAGTYNGICWTGDLSTKNSGT